MNERPLTLGVALLVASACGSPDPGAPPYRIEVVDVTTIDPATGASSFELAERELTTVDDLNRLSGRYFTLRRGGTLTARDVAGSIVLDAEFNNGKSPDLRFDIVDGVVVALDYSTLAMLTASYQLEQVMLSLERTIGVSADSITADGTYELLYEPTFRQQGDVDATVQIKFNAFYLPGARQFGLARRSRFEEVPLSANRCVLAHEFGHALFEIAFFGNLAEDCDENAQNSDPLFTGRLSTEYAMRGMNEGFADIISFANTGGIDVLSGTGFSSDDRALIGTVFNFPDRSNCDGEFYCIGTLFARSLFEAFVADGNDQTSEEARGLLGQDVFEALSNARAMMIARADLPSPSSAIRACESESNDGYDAEVVSSFLGAFVESLAPARRASVCARFTENFESAFSEAAKSGCP